MKMADESIDEVSTMDITKLKVPDLKKELKNRGLSTTGNKNELLERLQLALKSNETGTADSIDDIEEDLLNDDDDEHIDERESLITDLDSALEPLEDLPMATKRKLESEDKSDKASGPAKKVILKRNTSEGLAAIVKASEDKPKETNNDEKSPDKLSEVSDEKKVIKLSELSVKERLEMRAKKFGVATLNDNTKKLARAERFAGSTSSPSNSAASIKLNDTNTSIDVLKQRAARFGGSVSSVMSDLEKEGKMEKRKERFGGTTSTTNGKSATDTDAAKAARLERFKTTVK